MRPLILALGLVVALAGTVWRAAAIIAGRPSRWVGSRLQPSRETDGARWLALPLAGFPQHARGESRWASIAMGICVWHTWLYRCSCEPVLRALAGVRAFRHGVCEELLVPHESRLLRSAARPDPRCCGSLQGGPFGRQGQPGASLLGASSWCTAAALLSRMTTLPCLDIHNISPGHRRLS